VRKFFIENALYWLKAFHVDGLRLDAVHAILDDSPKHILREIAESVRAAAGNRHVHLVLENEDNEAHWLERDVAAGTEAMWPRFYTAQWNDDLHHVLHTAITGENKGYYGEYLGDPAKLGCAIAEGFAFQGQMMTYREKARGEVCAHLPPPAFVAFLQNHDQIGNRAFGDRLAAGVAAPVLRAAAAIYLLLPQTPMLFMGEEWGALQPFPFFCDFGSDLAEAVRKGRREEFARFPEFQDPAQRERIPDPQSEQTFLSAKLRWEEIESEPHREWLAWYGRVLAKRRDSILPLLKSIRHAGVFEVVAPGAIVARWEAGSLGELVLATNLSDETAAGFPEVFSELIWREGGEGNKPGSLQPWTVVWSIEPCSRVSA
jgi:maltooligosyltrehalose trehalohydrolase